MTRTCKPGAPANAGGPTRRAVATAMTPIVLALLLLATLLHLPVDGPSPLREALVARCGSSLAPALSSFELTATQLSCLWPALLGPSLPGPSSLPLLPFALFLVPFAMIVVIVAAGLMRAHGHARVGAANQLTLFRAGLICLFVSCAFPQASVGWGCWSLAVIAASLDAIDGPVARRSDMTSPFGARFDMETDALLILVASMLVWRDGKAGLWVLCSGALRYVFVLAGTVAAWLAKPLPYSARRRAIGAIQVTALMIALCPLVPPPLSALVAATGLAILAASFATDVRSLWSAHRLNSAKTARTKPC